MPCLAGDGLDKDKARHWWRLGSDLAYTPQFGRVEGCKNPYRDVVDNWRQRGTRLAWLPTCQGCPAYRPTTRGDNPREIPAAHTDIGVLPYGLSDREHDCSGYDPD